MNNQEPSSEATPCTRHPAPDVDMHELHQSICAIDESQAIAKHEANDQKQLHQEGAIFTLSFAIRGISLDLRSILMIKSVLESPRYRKCGSRVEFEV